MKFDYYSQFFRGIVDLFKGFNRSLHIHIKNIVQTLQALIFFIYYYHLSVHIHAHANYMMRYSSHNYIQYNLFIKQEEIIRLYLAQIMQ